MSGRFTESSIKSASATLHVVYVIPHQDHIEATRRSQSTSFRNYLSYTCGGPTTTLPLLSVLLLSKAKRQVSARLGPNLGTAIWGVNQPSLPLITLLAWGLLLLLDVAAANAVPTNSCVLAPLPSPSPPPTSCVLAKASRRCLQGKR